MVPQSSGRAQYKVPCDCGSSLTLDAREFGRPRKCRSCGVAITVAWGRDPGNYKSIPVVVNRGGKPASPQRPRVVAVCECGYTETLEPGRIPPCPRCRKRMRIREDAQEPPKSLGPLVPRQVRAPLRTVVRTGARYADCPCGERMLLRAGSLNRSVRCPGCDRVHLVEAAAAPETRTAAAPAGAPKSSPPPAPAPARELKMGEFLCPCGEIHPPRTSRIGRQFECKSCGRKGRVEAERDPETQSVAMKAIITFEPPRPAPAPAAPPPPPIPEPGPEPPVEEAVSDEPPAIPDDAQAALCDCGSELLVNRGMVGQTVQCPVCASLVAVDATRNPRTGAVALQLRTVAEGEWALDDNE